MQEEACAVRRDIWPGTPAWGGCAITRCVGTRGQMKERIFRRVHHGGHDAADHDGQIPPSKFKPEPRALADDGSSAIIVPCAQCKEPLYVKELENNLYVCPKCGAHFRLNARQRIEYTLDEGSFEEWDRDVRPTDPLGFAAGGEIYQKKLTASQAKTEQTEAMVTGRGEIEGESAVFAIADFTFMGAPMGSVYGEKLARAAERAIALRLPLITFNASGGARMQEGLFSLMQMAKTTAAVAQLGAAGLPHIAVLTDPCYGGVTASYATVADIILAEPGARIGFAGKTLIEQNMRQKLPDDVQTAEFQLKHGMVDDVVHRRDLRQTLRTLLALHRTPRVVTPAPDEPARMAEDARREPALTAAHA
jgi:acetyl-CoA carboxylase carboxyl transferase subunit beta